MRESMPLLLVEALERGERERAHQHIEDCGDCSDEWAAYRETWRSMGDLPELEVPVRVRARFLDAAGVAEPAPASRVRNVVPFRRRPAAKWLAQAAAVVVIAGGSWFAGTRTTVLDGARTPATIASITPAPYSIAEERIIPASEISPHIVGRPDIQNVQFLDPQGDKVGLSFDVTSRVTVTGSPGDRSMVRLLSYVLENENSMAQPRSRAIEWVKQTYSDPQFADPEIAGALARLLRSDEHEGVRIRAAETLKTMPAPAASATRAALIEALKNDPNPAVRIKAVEALANLSQSGEVFDPVTIDTLREKAAQSDENLYVRAKAAEVLSSVKLQ
ncbi:MAG TPA: HEAT repeat domain-containing protein [Thermoanaerobaculia bacterium]|nr:HEAT repeat domain-containing protein [Thermoanaerobaculia bacterium]